MGAPVAAIMIRKQKDLVAHFLAAGAISSATARPASGLRLDEGAAFRILRRNGVIRETDRGMLYLDEANWLRHRQAQRKVGITLVVLLVILAVLAYSGILKSS